MKDFMIFSFIIGMGIFLVLKIALSKLTINVLGIDGVELLNIITKEYIGLNLTFCAAILIIIISLIIAIIVKLK